MRASLVGRDGATTDRLLELKFIHVNPTRYTDADARHPSRCRSVERRAGGLHQLYVKKARKIDRQYSRTPAGTVGPVERRLSLFGDVLPLVVGAFGEHNAYFDELIRAAALAGSERHWRRMRCTSREQGRGLLVAMMRRTMGLAGVRANAQLLLRRLGHVGGALPGLQNARLQLQRWRNREGAGEFYIGGGRGGFNNNGGRAVH